MRRHHFLDQRRQRDAVERLAGRQLGQLRENVAAPLRLLAKQPHIVDVGRTRLQRPLQLLDHDCDGRERRAEFVGRGRRQSIELRQMLLARQHQFGRRQSLGDLPALFGDLPGIDPDEADREQDREPDSEQIDPRQFQRIVGVPRQRIMHEHQRRRAHDGESTQHDRDARRQRRCRKQHRRKEQECEWILQAAGEEQQHRQLGDVECQQPRRARRLEPLCQAETQPQRDIEPRR